MVGSELLEPSEETEQCSKSLSLKKILVGL